MEVIGSEGVFIFPRVPLFKPFAPSVGARAKLDMVFNGNCRRLASLAIYVAFRCGLRALPHTYSPPSGKEQTYILVTDVHK
jgi:hypothetical protein